MKELAILGIIGSVIVITVITVLIFKNRRKKREKESLNRFGSSSVTDPVRYKNNYITPAVFKTGFVYDTPQSSAGNCTSVLYPINQPYVKYGIPGVSDNCSCTEFIKAP